MAVPPEEVLRVLKSGEYAPVYFLQGEEPFYIDEIAGFIEANALKDSQKEFNQIILYGKEVAMHQVLLNARRFPMMSDRQVVIVKESQEISDFKTVDSQKMLEQYILNPLPSTILVFCNKYKKTDGRTSLGANLRKHTVFVDTKKMYDNQIPAWVENYANSLGLETTPDAAKLMADYNGTNLDRIAGELKKISVNLKDDNIVDVKGIQKYVGINRDYNVFELTKAIMIKDVMKANRIVNYFDANTRSNPVIPIVALIFNLFTRLIILHTAKDKSDKGLVAAMGVNPYFLREYKIGADNYSLVKVLENIQHIETADLQMKGVDRPSISDGQVLRDLTFKILH